MSASWKKNDGGRARKIKAEAQAEADRHQYDLTKAAVREVLGRK